ncbi:IS1182 family transposase [Catenulispora sp. GAS73]|uniref:IS1182 family transposase n=1 Tax=Catenulispora sp. GAS73 TaxID=3156269 RepID=UPI0035162AFF
MSLKAVAWPEPDPVVASAVRRIFRCKDLPLAVAVRDEFGELFSDALFAEAFLARGRPAWSPGRLALVTVLQKAENLTDRAAEHAVATRLDWRYALGLGLDEDGFDASVLSEFRTRVVEHHLEEQVLAALLAALAERGLVEAGGRQRTDSTHVIAAVRDLNRLELAGEAVRAAAEALAAATPGWLAAQVDIADWTLRYGHRVDSWRLPASKTKRDALALSYGRDGFALVAAVFDGPGPHWLRELPAVQALRVIMLQNYTRTADATGREVVKRREASPEGEGLPPAHLRLGSPYDTDARWGGKKVGDEDVFWWGYKVHVSETCDDPGSGPGPGGQDGGNDQVSPPAQALHVITNVVTTHGGVVDNTMTGPIHNDLAGKGLTPARHYVDAGYPSAEHLVTAQREHGITIVAPIRIDSSAQARAAAGFARADFGIDFDTRTATCPAGQVSATWTDCVQKGTDKIVITFAAADCRPCPSRTDCTSSKRGYRQITIGTREAFTAQTAARATQTDTDWKQDYKRRAGIEGTINQIGDVTGIRRARYRGLPKTHADHITAACAINLIRWHAWTNNHLQGRTRTSHLTRLQAALAA